MADKVKDQVEDLKKPTLESGKLRSTESRKALADAMIVINQSEVRQKKDLDKIGSAVSLLHFVKPETTDPAKLYGYTTDDIIHTDDSYRHATCDFGIAYLKHGLGYDLYEDSRDVMIALLEHKRTAGGRAPIKSMLEEDGSLHKNVTDAFRDAYGNGELGYHGVNAEWKKLDKHVTDRMPRIAEQLAKRKVTTRGDIQRMISGTEVILKNQKITVYADATARAYFEALETEKTKSAEKERKKNARTKGLETVKQTITDQGDYISSLENVEKEIPMQWNAKSRPAIIKANKQILEGQVALRAAYLAGRCNRAAPKE